MQDIIGLTAAEVARQHVAIDAMLDAIPKKGIELEKVLRAAVEAYAGPEAAHNETYIDNARSTITGLLVTGLPEQGLTPDKMVQLLDNDTITRGEMAAVLGIMGSKIQYPPVYGEEIPRETLDRMTKIAKHYEKDARDFHIDVQTMAHGLAAMEVYGLSKDAPFINDLLNQLKHSPDPSSTIGIALGTYLKPFMPFLAQLNPGLGNTDPLAPTPDILQNEPVPEKNNPRNVVLFNNEHTIYSLQSLPDNEGIDILEILKALKQKSPDLNYPDTLEGARTALRSLAVRFGAEPDFFDSAIDDNILTGKEMSLFLQVRDSSSRQINIDVMSLSEQEWAGHVILEESMLDLLDKANSLTSPDGPLELPETPDKTLPPGTLVAEAPAVKRPGFGPGA